MGRSSRTKGHPIQPDDPRTLKSQRGRRSRRRGHDGERELRNALAEQLGDVVRRHLGQSRDGGADLELGDTWLIEVKRRARIAGVHEWMEQAQAAAHRARKRGCIAFRADGQGWIVGFRLDDAVNLLRESLVAVPAVPWADE